MRKIPTTSVPLRITDIIRGLSSLVGRACIEDFEKSFADYIGVKNCIATNKALTALYIMLMAMRKLSGKNEIILPAYTVPAINLAIRKAGFKTRLCDISLDTFNMDMSSLKNNVSDNTIGIIPVHMFGFPCQLQDVIEICRQISAFMIEDPAQAMGAELNGRKLGSFGDTAIFSLCKGKILSTFNGGFAVTGNDELASLMRIEREKLSMPQRRFLMPAILVAYSLAMRPSVYGTFFPIIEKFKSTELHPDFPAEKYTDFQASVAIRLLSKIEDIIQKRIRIGMAMYNELKGCDWLRLPKIIPGSRPVFNHFPVLFDDVKRLEKIEKSLWEKGIDTARFYMRPIHHIYDLGYGHNPDPFPNATYLAERLLVLPSHPYMNESDAGRIVEAFKNV